MALTPGTRLGTYEIRAALGAGGMGEVYRARDVRLGREVALKVLPAAVTSSADRLARFEREARTAARLNHPNIVTLYSVEDADGIRFLTMELVEGEPLDRHVQPGGLPVARVLEIALPLAHALVAAHEHGVVHRDLKPANVMVARDGWVKVLDFGLAKLAPEGDGSIHDATLAATATQAVSAVGQVLGTVPYMAPEQIRGEAVDARADLFALGIIVYELATGRRPFTGATSADISSAILRDVPMPLLQVRDDLPRDLNRIVTRLLEKQPGDRFQTARDVYNELRYVQREIESGGGAPAPASVTARPPAPASGAGGLGSTSAAFPSAIPAAGEPLGASGSGASATSAGAPSIAVLPFVNRSRGEDDEYFSDGLADELVSVLTKIRGLRVAARASSFQFKGSSEDVAVIAQKLNVATLLDGSVRKAGNRVRISVQLVHAADRMQLWSETYDRSLDDIFAVQDDIAQSVVKELRTTLLGAASDSGTRGQAQAEVAAAAKGHGQDPEAHRLYLHGKFLVERVNEADSRLAVRYLEEALARDPSHAAAWTTLAHAHINGAAYGWETPNDGYRRAREAVDRALALEPDFAEAYIRLAWLHRTHDRDAKRARAAARRALELAPGSTDALRASGTLAQYLGRFDEAEPLLTRALDQDPLNVASHLSLAALRRMQGRLPEAEHALRRAIELTPQRITTHHILAIVLADQGRDAEALEAVSHEPADWARLTGASYVHYLAGRRAESDAALAELEARHANDSGFQIAALHAVRGEPDTAFAWLERALASNDAGIGQVKMEPVFASLHGDPRWNDLLQRAGLIE